MTIDDVNAELDAKLQSGEPTVKLLKEALADITDQLTLLYQQHRPIREVVNDRCLLLMVCPHCAKG